MRCEYNLMLINSYFVLLNCLALIMWVSGVNRKLFAQTFDIPLECVPHITKHRLKITWLNFRTYFLTSRCVLSTSEYILFGTGKIRSATISVKVLGNARSTSRFLSILLQFKRWIIRKNLLIWFVFIQSLQVNRLLLSAFFNKNSENFRPKCSLVKVTSLIIPTCLIAAN